MRLNADDHHYRLSMDEYISKSFHHPHSFALKPENTLLSFASVSYSRSIRDHFADVAQ